MKTSENISVTNYKLHYIFAGDGLVAIYVVNTPLTPLLELSPTKSHHTDHVSISLNINLGSITEITNEQEQLMQRMAYNAWGVRELIQENTGTNNFLFDRGFTRHSLPRFIGEHLDKL